MKWTVTTRTPNVDATASKLEGPRVRKAHRHALHLTRAAHTVVLTSLGFAGCAEPSEGDSIASVGQGIIGGGEAWLDSGVAIQTTQCRKPPLHCSATLISPTAVLTAAHCVSLAPDTGSHPNGVDPTQESTFSVTVGCHDIDSPSCVWQSLASITPHPSWNPLEYDLNYDIAVVKLATAVSIKPSRLVTPPRMSEVDVGDIVRHYGWGVTALDGEYSPVLKSIDIPIQGIDSTMIDTGFGAPGGGQVAAGDSGGAAAGPRGGGGFLLAVNSYYTRESGVVTDHAVSVPGYFSWIKLKVSDLPAQSYLPSAQIMAVNGT
jgi:hypothetical protein